MLIMEKTVYSDKYVVVKQLSRKNKPPYTIVKFRPSFVVVAVTRNGKIILVKKYREPLGREILELPAGLKENGGKRPTELARHSLLEKTGYSAKTWVSLGQFSMEPSIVATKPFIFLALDASKKPQLHLATGNGINYGEYSWKEIEELIRKKQLTDSFSIAAIYAAKSYLKL